MIEVIYSGETREPKAQEKGILAAMKNIRQIGNAGKTTRIYVEDCVMGFLERQMQRSEPVVAALLGKESKEDGVTYIFINGALVPKGIKVKGETLDFSSQAFLDLYEEAEQFFSKSEILGWYLPAYEMIGKYGASLGQNSRLFLLEDPTESEEIFYLWEQNHLMKQDGYYIYYQRNEEMKAYMQTRKEKAEESVQKRKTWAVVEGSGEIQKRDLSGNDKKIEKIPKKEMVDESGLSKKSRNKPGGTWKEAIKGAFEKREADEFVDDYEEMEKTSGFEMSQPKLTTFLYGASTVLAIVVLVIGITLINNYEKMYEMQEAIETIAMTITEVQNAETETKSGHAENEESDETTEQAEEYQSEEGQNDGNNQMENGQEGEETGKEENSEIQSTHVTDLEETMTEGEHRYYVIQEGDTLASISRKMYQTTDKIEEIKRLNEGIKENELNVGQKIILP